MKIKTLQLTFENCEIMEIDGNYIGDFCIDDIKTSVFRSACNWIDEQTFAGLVVIELHKDANKTHYSFGIDEYKTTVFNRIKEHNDITNVSFTLYDQYAEKDEEDEEKKFSFAPEWGEGEYTNEYQKTYISNCGNLYLVISKDKVIRDFFHFKEINNEELMDFYFDMLDVGDKYSNPNRYEEGDNV